MINHHQDVFLALDVKGNSSVILPNTSFNGLDGEKLEVSYKVGFGFRRLSQAIHSEKCLTMSHVIPSQ